MISTETYDAHIAGLTAKLAEAERERDEARQLARNNAEGAADAVRTVCELRAEVAILRGDITIKDSAISHQKQAREAAEAEVSKLQSIVISKTLDKVDVCIQLDAAEARLTALRDAVEAAPCHDFCRWQQARHEIPYGTHHPACWKVAALAKSGES
jgi:chromosome segregation ATPase